jgi:viroplasmin and RNaseH domain-containing protein
MIDELSFESIINDQILNKFMKNGKQMIQSSKSSETHKWVKAIQLTKIQRKNKDYFLINTQNIEKRHSNSCHNLIFVEFIGIDFLEIEVMINPNEFALKWNPNATKFAINCN